MVMAGEGTNDFQERPFTCPYCAQETMVELPPEMDTIPVGGAAVCENCGSEFLIENDVPRRSLQ